VTPEQLTGKEHYCVLIDGTIRRFPIARIQVDTPYYSGEVEAMCMKKPIYDLVIGNIQGVRDTPDAAWQATCIPEEASVVATRAQTEKEPVTPLKVPELQPVPVYIDKLKDAQAKDGTLECVRELVKDGRRKTTRGRSGVSVCCEEGCIVQSLH
jgi:hypothetical protein